MTGYSQDWTSELFVFCISMKSAHRRVSLSPTGDGAETETPRNAITGR